jgi:hypothetical protein
MVAKAYLVQKPITATMAVFTIFPDFLNAVTTIDPQPLIELCEGCVGEIPQRKLHNGQKTRC